MDANTEINRVANVGTGLIGSQVGRLFSSSRSGCGRYRSTPGTEARVRTANVVKSPKIELQNKRKQNEYLILHPVGLDPATPSSLVASLAPNEHLRFLRPSCCREVCSAHLPWSRSLNGARVVTGISSYVISFAATSGSVSNSAFASSTDSTLMRNIGPAFSRNQNCSILPSS